MLISTVTRSAIERPASSYISKPIVRGGETEFPHFEVPKGIDMELWCQFLDCGDETSDNLVSAVNENEQVGSDGEEHRLLRFKPKAGNAIFWENLDAQKVGIPGVAHAGKPVTNGTKIGMNIWTREREHTRKKAKVDPPMVKSEL